MRKLMITLTLLMTAAASPALAEGFRAELHGGWDRGENSYIGDSKSGATYGFAAGYDFNINENFFMGVEAGLDSSSTKICVLDGCLKAGLDFGSVVRFGYQNERAKIYAIGGYSRAKLKGTIVGESFKEWDDGWRVGGGYELNFDSGVYAKVEYRYTNYSDGFSRHSVIAGVGYQF
jgi:outer membrane immunogenic protein